MSLASLSKPSYTPTISSHGEGKHLRPDRNTVSMWDMFLHFKKIKLTNSKLRQHQRILDTVGLKEMMI